MAAGDSSGPNRSAPRLTTGVRDGLAWIEEVLYIIVGLVLLAAGVLVVVGTISGLIHSIRVHQGAVNIGIVLLDRILLLLIVAELMHTLRFVVLRGRIVVEPFLFVGLIAVVRRVLIITAELRWTRVSRVVVEGLFMSGLVAGVGRPSRRQRRLSL